MFGRMRSSPSPLELLEMERPPSKHFKDDSLSIYEATVMKLKQGSQRSLISEHNLSLSSQDSMDFESSENGSEDSPKVSNSGSKQGTPTCSSGTSVSVSSSPDQEQTRRRGVSIHLLFSKYNSCHQKQESPCLSQEFFVAKCSSTSTSASSSDSESTGGSN